MKSNMFVWTIEVHLLLPVFIKKTRKQGKCRKIIRSAFCEDDERHLRAINDNYSCVHCLFRDHVRECHANTITRFIAIIFVNFSRFYKSLHRIPAWNKREYRDAFVLPQTYYIIANYIIIDHYRAKRKEGWEIDYSSA